MYKLLPKSTIHDSDDFPNSQTASVSAIPAQCQRQAVLAGGSFWVLESAFGRVDGVVKTAAGYCGGTLRKPSYTEVLGGKTGHTEAVKVTYDNTKISYKSLCDFFWETHDPTNKIYLDFGVGTHQRSAIFCSNEEERKQAQESKIRRQMKLNKRIVTKILALDISDFFLAENHHQKHYLQETSYFRVCDSLGLRSTQQFVESNLACKLNGILGVEAKLMADNLTKFLKTQELTKQTMSACEEIILELVRNEDEEYFENPRIAS
ncbi:hypothetical protein FNV43_RR13979 [Rhamnella rubrinervis]|uniref:peptide-methionine (S)-S-oxide reductase n=1 Tax=Rhamnella rubrinervis TaxID=2594499 RepID=A0A8K0MF41_9ROSA|nr:hypothetical protein FNV43_RR13979 [Rhamnella rubrinervis]